MSLILNIFAYVSASLFYLHVIEFLFISHLLKQTLAYELCLEMDSTGTRILVC
jgi:hypothetical protein